VAARGAGCPDGSGRLRLSANGEPVRSGSQKYRGGSLFDDHYHSHLLKTPTEVARALGYVQTNAEKHFGETGVDYFSSGHPRWAELLASPVSWLLNEGWKLAMLRRAATFSTA
jgi:hypothetical protein